MAEMYTHYFVEGYAGEFDDVRVIPHNIEDIRGVHDDHNEGYFATYPLFSRRCLVTRRNWYGFTGLKGLDIIPRC